ncbi:TGS1 Trimethylguanosine synthase [Candida maltosa Xu316]
MSDNVIADNSVDEVEVPSRSESPIINPDLNKISKKSKNKKKKKNRKHNKKTIQEDENDDKEMDDQLQEETPEPLAYTFDPLSYNAYTSSDANPSRNNQHSYQGELLMHTYHTLSDGVRKFWNRRYKLFSKFDDGIYLSEELWYSVTPEAIAKYIANLFHKLLPDATSVLDLCCGGGGNTIHFAQLFDHVGAIDINPINLYCTKHNCGIYNVAEKIWPLEADWNEITALLPDGSVNYSWIPESVRRDTDDNTTPQFDFIFSSPPWGGTDYSRDVFDLEQMKPFPISQMLQQLKRYTDNVGLFLPKSSDLDQLAQATQEFFGEEAQCRVVRVNSSHRVVAILALIGYEIIDRFDEINKPKHQEEDEEDDEGEYDEGEYEEGEYEEGEDDDSQEANSDDDYSKPTEEEKPEEEKRKVTEEEVLELMQQLGSSDESFEEELIDFEDI